MMPGIQEWIHKLEVGEGTRYIKLAAVALGLLALTVIYDIREFKNFATQEAMDAGQLARNLAEGKGYTTDFVRPLSIHLLQRHRDLDTSMLKEPHPDLANPPVYPLILAGLMKILPFNYEIPRGMLFWSYQPERLIAFFNQALFYAAIFIVFRLGLRLFDASVAWVSAIILAGTNLFWRFSVSGLSTLLLIVIFLAIVWCLLTLEQNIREQTRGIGWLVSMAALAGVLVGIGGLTRYSFAWLMLPVLGYFAIYLGERRLPSCVAALAAFLVIFSPWVARNYSVSGTAFGTAGYAVFHETSEFPGNRLERYLTPEFEVALNRVEAEEFIRKLLVNSSEIIQNDLPKLGGNWLSAFFLVGLLLPFHNAALNRIRVFVLLCLAVLGIVQALGKTHLSADYPEVNSENLLVLLAPMVFVFGVGMYFILLDQINLPFLQLRTVITSLFSLLACAPLILVLLPPRSIPLAHPPYFPPSVYDFARYLRHDELMMSDMPWAVAWYGNRQCVWVSLDAPSDSQRPHTSDFFRIHDYQKPIYGLYLSMITTDAKLYSQMMTDKDYAWGRFILEGLLRTNVPVVFPLKYAPPGILNSGQLFLSDRERWPKPKR